MAIVYPGVEGPLSCYSVDINGQAKNTLYMQDTYHGIEDTTTCRLSSNRKVRRYANC